MQNFLAIAITCLTCSLFAQNTQKNEAQINAILSDPSKREIQKVLADSRKKDLYPASVIVHDTIQLANNNILFVISHQVEGHVHFGAVAMPQSLKKKLPVIIFATGGDGMNKEFNLSTDFSHASVQFPDFLGGGLDTAFIVVIPSFRGQELIIGDNKFQSGGDVGDAFDGATTDALAFLNVVLTTFPTADENRIATYGGSRGGAVALLAAARDKRIMCSIAIAAPTDMTELYKLYPDQFKLLFFNDLLAGKITEQDARKKFIASSPMNFVTELPRTQIHHDTKDPFVPVAFAEKLSAAMKSENKEVSTYYYKEGIHGFWNDSAFWIRIQDFLRPLLR